MKRKQVTLLLSCLLIFGGGWLLTGGNRRFSPAPPHTSSGSDRWTEFTSREGGYQVDLPGRPRHRDGIQEEVLGLKVTVHQISSTRGNPPTSFEAYSFDLPGPLPEEDGGPLLDAICRRQVADARGREISLRPVTLGPHLGRELVMEFADAKGEWSRKYRVYVAGGRIYAATAVRPKEGMGDDTARFLDSFRIVSE